MQKKISVIICAYNEAERIGNVLSAVIGHPLISEIIVVNDGSIDDTKSVVKTFPKVLCLTLQKNKGKSYALAQGIQKAHGDCLLLLDADLVGLTQDNISALVKPVLEHNAQVTLSLRKNSLWVYKMLHLDFVSGERCLPRALLLPHVEQIEKLPSYGIEVFMNELIIKNKLRINSVFWNNVRITSKSEKIGAWAGFKAELTMLRQINSVIPLYRLLLQNYKLLTLLCSSDINNTRRQAM